ncbi:hypothetical protein [Acrocarpospora macrocephala]|uniref:hypothetical protein n=1 Tax=Acrocarpospora macrocephala TaxID=150177 RepID=UPI0012D2FA72|nr:hypothetical protein [Acrocarpospora macrocephala]
MNFLLGVLTLAAIQAAGLGLCRWRAPQDALDMAAWLVTATFWWLILPCVGVREWWLARRIRRAGR